MFCNQCEQTAKGGACVKIGVCGKNEEIAALQDLLIHATQGLALYANEGRKHGVVDTETDHFTFQAIFSTLTNVDFDSERFVKLITRAVSLRNSMKEKVTAAGGKTDFSEDAASFIPADNLSGLIAQGQALDLINKLDEDENIRSLKQTLFYGLKGIAATDDF